MAFLIDRRQNSKNKSTVNRQRFLRRHRDEIRRSLSEKLRERSITETDKGESVSISGRNTNEPFFRHGKGGRYEKVFPGNREFGTGDRLPRPDGAGGGSGNQAGNTGEGIDDFVFEISQQEFLELLFEDLELPNLARKEISEHDDFKSVRAGFSSTGAPANISIVRSMRAASARRIAVSASKRRELRALLEQRKMLEAQATDDPERLRELDEQISDLRQRINRVPFLDEIDLRFHQTVLQPIPRSKAVMFCVMDVSGSMDQATKDLAKRFFILLYLFLNRHYLHTEVVFIRHHTVASEVDEQQFFYSRESGGTVVSSALRLTQQIIRDRFPLNEWNIYVAQASDGDNWPEDGKICQQLLTELLPQLQYMAYVEISRIDKPLWQTYDALRRDNPSIFAMQHITGAGDIYPVLRELLKKQTL